VTAEEVMRAGLASWNEGGIDAFVQHMTPEAVWHAPDYVDGTEWRGREALAKDWHEQFDSVFENIDVELEQIEHGPERFLARVHSQTRVRDTGTELDWHSYFVGTIEGDLFTELWVFVDGNEARKVAGLA
jgi:ketosteroid isomerase-like protein